MAMNSASIAARRELTLGCLDLLVCLSITPHKDVEESGKLVFYVDNFERYLLVTLERQRGDNCLRETLLIAMVAEEDVTQQIALQTIYSEVQIM
ncbi:hypothetical protein ANTRET_LOCUS5466 [Anthophora retusa]